MWSKCLSPATMSLHVCMLVSLVLPCINQHKLQLFRNYQQVRVNDGASLTFVLFIFLFDHMPLSEHLNYYSKLNVYIFQIK